MYQMKWCARSRAEHRDGRAMTDFNIGPPGPGGAGGSGFNSEKATHVNHLLVFVKAVGETCTNAKGEEYEVARCDYVLCTLCMRRGPITR